MDSGIQIWLQSDSTIVDTDDSGHRTLHLLFNPFYLTPFYLFSIDGSAPKPDFKKRVI